jgi:hypothetical protein
MACYEFWTNFESVACLLLCQEKRVYYAGNDPLQGAKWVPVPEDGSIPSECLMVPDRLVKVGATRFNFRWSRDLDSVQMQGMSLLIFTSDPQGNPIEQIDRIPYHYMAAPPIALGGWVR